MLLGALRSISSNILVANLMKDRANKVNDEKHKTLVVNQNETIGNQKKKNLLSDTEYQIPRLYWV